MTDESKKSIRRTFLELVLGLVLGFVVACLAGPRAISIWYQPPSQDAFSCAGSVEKALSQFIVLEFVVAALGAVGLSLGMWFLRRLLRREPPKSP